MGKRAEHVAIGRTRSLTAKTLVVAVLAVFGLLTAQLAVLAVHDEGFELEGNAVNDADPDNEIDWADIYADFIGGAGLYTSVFVSEPPDTDVTYFKGGGSKDINDVTEWLYAANPSAPDKDEITNAYAYADFSTGEFNLYFGADRFSNDGDAAVGFWFFQEPVTLSDISSQGGKKFNGAHTDGDVFIVSNFTNGGEVDTVFVYQWAAGDLVLADSIDPNPGTDCELSPDDQVCGTVSWADDINTVPWPYTPKANVGVPQEFPPGAFFEGGVNLSAVLPGGFGCFSSFLAETRSSQETTAQLKDFELGQFRICDASIQIASDATNEINDEHTFTVTANKEIAGAVSPADDDTLVTVEFTSENGTIIDDETCFTSGGTCDVTVNSSVGDTITAHASATIEVLPGDTFDVETDGVGDNSGDAVKTYVDARIAITPDATNEVGDDHTFTVKVEKNLGVGWVAAAGEFPEVTLTDSNNAAFYLTDAEDTCATTGTDAAGECTVTFSSDSAGMVTGHAVIDIDLDLTSGLDVHRETDGVDGNSDDAVKTFVDAYITIEADATNEVGAPHTFTVTVYKDEGIGSGYQPADGEEVTFDGVGSLGTEITGNGTCVTNLTGAHLDDGAGECTIEVASDVAGQITVTASSTLELGPVGEEIPVSVSTDGSTRPDGQANSDPAVKTWVDARISITPDQTNEVGDDHTFNVLVEKNLGAGAGWEPASGETVTVTLTDSLGASAFESANTCGTTVAGACSVTFSSDNAGVTTGHATVSLDLGETDATTVDRATGTTASPDAVKTWVDAYITITADGVNRVGDEHTFTVTVWKDTGDGNGYVRAADEDVSAIETAGIMTAITGGTCMTDVTDADGECTVVVDSDVTGTVTVSASSTLDLGPAGEEIPVTVSTDGSARPNGQLNSGPVTKAWVDAKIAIDPDGVNRVGDDHVFTVSVMVDPGDGFVDVEGQLVEVSYTAAGGADDPADATCTTATAADVVGDPLLTVGECSVTVTSSATGTITAHASADVTVEGLVFTVETDGLGENSDDAVKTYVDAYITIEPDATNRVGVDHEFDVVVKVDAGDGAGFVDVADGQLVDVTYTESNGATAQADDSCLTVGGTCSVTINSPTSGQIDAQASTTVTVAGLAIDIVTDGVGNNSDDAVKTYVDAYITIEPDATNRVGVDHEFDVVVKVDAGDGAGFVDVADGQLVDVTYTESNGATAQADDSCLTVGGTCSVTINSPTSGQIDAQASTTVTVAGLAIDIVTDGVGNNSDDAVKTYVDAYITIEPDATNRVGVDHEFDVVVKVDAGDGAGFVDVADGQLVDVTYTESNGATAQADDSCLTVGGTCSVTINSPTSGQIDAQASTTVTVAGLAIDIVTDGVGNNSDDAVKTYVDAYITIEPDATNRVGVDHEFDVVVKVDAGDGAGFVDVADGQLVDVTYTESNGATAQADDSCLTVGGTCSVTINSPTSGQIDAQASTTVTVAGLAIDIVTDGVGNNSDDAVKTYVDAYITIEPDATNRVGVDHEFDVVVKVDAGDGAGFVDVADGQLVDVTYTESNGATAQADDSCLTVGGTCSVTINSPTSGQIDAQASTTVTVAGLAIDIVTDGVGNNSDDAVKTYVDAYITIEPDATNRVGVDHEFTVSVMADPGDGFAAVEGQTVNVSYTAADGANDPADDSCVTSVAGECSVTVSSSTTGTITAHASAEVTVEGLVFTVETDGLGGNSDDAVKTYVDAKIAIEPDGVNEVGLDHTFTVSVMEDNGDGLGFVGASGETVTVEFISSGGADVIGNEVCVTGGTGECSVTISSDNVGLITAHATTTASVGPVGDEIDIDLATDGVGNNSGDAEKRYVDAKIEITPDGVNEVGDEHAFTVTVTVDPGDTTFDGDITGYVVLPPAPYEMSDCAALTFAANVATCTVTINSAHPGVFEAGATAVVTFSDADGNEAVVERSTDGSTTASGLENSSEAIKRYVDSYVTIAEDALNGITEDHTFTVTVYGDDGIAAADGGDSAEGFTTYAGATVSVEALFGSTAGSITGGTCVSAGVTDAAGTCTVFVTSDVEGFIEVSAESMLMIDGVTLTRTTDSSETTAELGGSGQFNSGPATKTWVDASLRWYKVDQLLVPLGGATFEVDRTHDRFGVVVTEDPLVVLDNGPLDLDPDLGDFYLDGLVFGTYTVTETIPPLGYLGDSKVVTVSIVDLDDSDGIINNGPDVVIVDPWINTQPGEGCTPGFWQGGNGSQLWNVLNDPDFSPAGANPYAHDTVFSTFFSASGLAEVDDSTMLGLVDTGGTELTRRKAARSLVAAYLNASHSGVDYSLSQAQLVDLWDAAVANGSDQAFLDLHILLNFENNKGCDQ